ncbi:MAG TPA: FecR domain-containing protein [Rhizomicrobium sp.]|nr:FecR domain-containing protein [Rhizomicrobium sp.]
MSAAEIQSRAADFVNRHRDSGEWTPDDQAALDAWLAESPEHVVAYWRLDAAWERTQRLAALRPSKPEHSRGLIWRNVLRFSAAAIVIAAGTGAAFYFSKPSAPEARQFATEVGARKTIKLPDGSEIELNTNSVLRIAPGPNPRMAWLDRGEAYFKIQHDSAHPFVVMAQGRRVVDLGTEFLMRAEPKRLEVALVAGRAQLDSPNDPTQEPAVLTPGDVAIATANAINVTSKSTKVLSDELSWRQGLLVFKYTTLEEAAAEFNRYNRKKIIITDPKVASLTIVGTFPSNDVSAFTDAAQAIFGLKIENRNGEIAIKR